MPGTGVRANELRSNPIKTQPFGQGLASYKSTRRRSPFMPGTGARANELRSNTIKTQPFGQRAGLLQIHPVGAHPLCPERVPERMNYAPNSSARVRFSPRIKKAPEGAFQ
jgi:hypothetical protein